MYFFQNRYVGYFEDVKNIYNLTLPPRKILRIKKFVIYSIHGKCFKYYWRIGQVGNVLTIWEDFAHIYTYRESQLWTILYILTYEPLPLEWPSAQECCGWTTNPYVYLTHHQFGVLHPLPYFLFSLMPSVDFSQWNLWFRREEDPWVLETIFSHPPLVYVYLGRGTPTSFFHLPLSEILSLSSPWSLSLFPLPLPPIALSPSATPSRCLKHLACKIILLPEILFTNNYQDPC